MVHLWLLLQVQTWYDELSGEELTGNPLRRQVRLSSKGQAEVAVDRHGLLVLMELQLIRG